MSTLAELTELMHAFVSAKGWYVPESPRPQTPRNLAISLSLEVNEVLEHFQWGESATDPDALAGELADVALYLLQLASISGIDLDQAIRDKLRVNYGRTWDEFTSPPAPLSEFREGESAVGKSPSLAGGEGGLGDEG